VASSGVRCALRATPLVFFLSIILSLACTVPGTAALA